MANFQPYAFDPRGDGIHYPIRQAPIRSSTGALNQKTSATLYRKRKAKPKAFASAIHHVPMAFKVEPSSFSQYGRGPRYNNDLKLTVKKGGFKPVKYGTDGLSTVFERGAGALRRNPARAR